MYAKPMARWLRSENGSGMEECLVSPPKALITEVCHDSVNNSDEKLKLLFDEFLEVFLREVSSVSCFRPLPPLVGEGQEVDLFKLHLVVRKRGGYCSVSEKGLWGMVAADCGFDLRFGAALKLVYVKYLDTLDRWLKKIVKDKHEEKNGVREAYVGYSLFVKELESDLKVYLSGVSTKVKNEEEPVECKKSEAGSGDGDVGFLKLIVDFQSVDKKWSNENKGGNVNLDEKQRIDRATEDDFVIKKRKRECFAGVLDWIHKVAKDPCNPDIGQLPERNKWKSYEDDLQWKQILLAREARCLKKKFDASSLQSVWQHKKQKMHPSMYDDDQICSERLRCSQRLLFAKDSSRKAQEQLGTLLSPSGCLSDENASDKYSDSSSDSPGFGGKCRRQKRVSIGRSFQAELPVFCGDDYESDSKWLGTKIWPLDKGEYNRSLIERDPIGKGRQESCGCQLSGSPECIRFHVQEKRMKLKLELGPAFYRWKFDGMGEDVALSWTKSDESKFHDLVESNRLSSEKYFWGNLFKFFPKKGREALVSYYYNVFLLQHRGHQNRSCTSNIDSDNEESEFGPVGNTFGQIAAEFPGSIFCSPKKSHTNSR